MPFGNDGRATLHLIGTCAGRMTEIHGDIQRFGELWRAGSSSALPAPHQRIGLAGTTLPTNGFERLLILAMVTLPLGLNAHAAGATGDCGGTPAFRSAAVRSGALSLAISSSWRTRHLRLCRGSGLLLPLVIPAASQQN